MIGGLESLRQEDRNRRAVRKEALEVCRHLRKIGDALMISKIKESLFKSVPSPLTPCALAEANEWESEGKESARH